MKKIWFTDPDRFSVLIKILRGSVRGGVLKSSKLTDDEVRLADIGVEDNIFKKEQHEACPRCRKKYLPELVPSVCEECQVDLDEIGTQTTGLEYIEDVWSTRIPDIINNLELDYNVSFRKHRSVDDVPVSELNHAGDKETQLHISPYFTLDKYLIFSGHDDVFFDWAYLPALITDPDGVQEEIENFLKTSGFNASKIGDDTQKIEHTYYSGPAAPGPENTHQSSWYTLLDRVEKSTANDLSKKRFGINYNEMYERLGIEFLQTIFPHAMTIHLGGNFVPDGLLHIHKENSISSYIIESKCYADGFKIFDEQYKGSQYIDNFVENIEGDFDCGYNLAGYGFVGYEFKEDRMPDDIYRFIESNVERNMDIFCLNGEMMELGMDRLRHLYRRQPSATYRIYKHMDWYRSCINGLIDFTSEHRLNADDFASEFIITLEAQGHKETDTEEKIKNGFKPPKSFQDLKTEVSEHLPEDYPISSD